MSEFPIVKIHYVREHDWCIENSLSELSDLLKREQPFVFMGEGLPEEKNENVEERKKVALWMKANSQDVQKWIKGHIHIAKDDEEFQAMEAFAVIFKKFWGYPMVVVKSSSEALSVAQRLLVS